jgi:thiosulfate dehydrogenase [quinone] large subunit
MQDITLKKNPINALIFMRILIGWHFLFEGIVKLYNPSWTASGYLLGAQGFLKPFFVWLSGDSLIGFVDNMNIVGLMAVGLALILGYWERIGALVGIVLLLFYYFAQPPWPGIESYGTEGNYWFVNKNLIEAAALLVIYMIPTGKYFGIERIFPHHEPIHSPKTN